MLKTRVITAVIGFIIAVACITAGDVYYDGIITLLALLGWREFALLFKDKKVNIQVLLGYVAVLAVMMALSASALPLAGTLALAFILLLYVRNTFNSKVHTTQGLSHTVFGLLYIVLGMGALLIIRKNELYMFMNMPFEYDYWGVTILWLLLLTTWASDTLAYFSGVAFGKHHIVPSISPNKTLEGFVGGFVGTLLMGIIYAFFVGIPVSMGAMVGLIVGVLAPLGDLFESKLKRICNVKDSGVLLPGHGGVLDRFDSLLFTAPAVWAYITLL